MPPNGGKKVWVRNTCVNTEDSDDKIFGDIKGERERLCVRERGSSEKRVSIHKHTHTHTHSLTLSHTHSLSLLESERREREIVNI